MFHQTIVLKMLLAKTKCKDLVHLVCKLSIILYYTMLHSG